MSPSGTIYSENEDGAMSKSTIAGNQKSELIFVSVSEVMDTCPVDYAVFNFICINGENTLPQCHIGFKEAGG